MSSSQAIIKTRPKLSSIWLIPILALLVSVWIVTQHYLDRGPEIRITFQTAEGIEAGKTKIKALNVEVGIVERVELHRDLESVIIHARIKPDAVNLLRKETQFWVEKPRIGSRGISGLSTLLSGAYIELGPGEGPIGKTEYTGYANRPLTVGKQKGVNVFLLSAASSSLSEGAPVLYRGFRVGQITHLEVLSSGQLRASAFINEPYDRLVSSTSRFFNASGFSFRLTPEGMDFESESISSLMSGGVAFDVPNGINPGANVKEGQEFVLYDKLADIDLHPYQFVNEYLLLFDASTRGLQVGAPVEYRGIPVGSVAAISMDLISDDIRNEQDVPQVPVLIKVDTGRLVGDDSIKGQKRLQDRFVSYVAQGMRAALKNASLVTGQRVITLDFYPEVKAGEISQLERFTVLPTISDDVDRVISRVGIFVDKLNKLPLNETVVNANQTINSLQLMIEQANHLVKSGHDLLAQDETQAIPTELNNTLQQLQATLSGLSPNAPVYQSLINTLDQAKVTLQSVERVSNALDSQPSSILFSEPKDPDLTPGAHQDEK
ncbi:intermembrane transport protein PqiB [Algibacillus agarilyticus]|uniref:intermembrane transport protein PqiB n=1 Tax=Algibacillus agarilyticus TaxID=2234133 RepID=UPI000DCFC3D2|nr:intermembrane transport protein PqiB [Algibacillus agarilyticus]